MPDLFIGRSSFLHRSIALILSYRSVQNQLQRSNIGAVGAEKFKSKSQGPKFFFLEKWCFPIGFYTFSYMERSEAALIAGSPPLGRPGVIHMRQVGFKIASRCLQDGPRCLQDGFKRVFWGLLGGIIFMKMWFSCGTVVIFTSWTILKRAEEQDHGRWA